MRKRLALGWAERELPDAVGLDLTGFLSRSNPSTGQRDPLKARAAYLYDGKTGVVWVSVDMLGISQALVERVRMAASNQHKLPPRAFTIAATHTHSAPSAVFLANCGIVDRDWNRELEQLLINLISDAVTAPKRYVNLRFAQTDVPGHSHNRRAYDDDGTQKEAGRDAAADTRLSAIVAHDRKTGDPVAAMVHFACHPVFHRDTLASSDYPGLVIERITSEIGGDFSALFIQGACADVNPTRHTDSVDDDLNEMVSSLSDAALELIRDRDRGLDLVPKLNARLRTVMLPWVSPFSEPELDEHLLSPADWTRAEKQAQARHIWAKRVQMAHTRGWWSDGLKMPVQVCTIGQLVIAAAGAEVFTETARKIEAAHNNRPVLTAGYANDLVGYLPPREEFQYGGYELEAAYRYFGYPDAFAPEGEELFRQTVDDILNVGTMASPVTK